MSELGGAFDETGDTVALTGRDQWRDFVHAVIGVIVDDAGGGRAEIRDEIVIDACMGVNPAGGRTILSGVVVAKGLQTVDGPRQIGIAIYDYRSLAAQLQMGPLDPL